MKPVLRFWAIATVVIVSLAATSVYAESDGVIANGFLVFDLKLVPYTIPHNPKTGESPTQAVYMTLTPGISIRDAVWVKSEPSGKLLGAIVEKSFFDSEQGQRWRADHKRPQNVMSINRPFDGLSEHQIHLGVLPEEDDVIALEFRRIDVPEHAWPAAEPHIVRISYKAEYGPRHMSIAVGTAGTPRSVSPAELGRIGPLWTIGENCQCGGGMQQITCSAGTNCASCACCKLGSVTGCCSTSPGIEGCTGGPWNCPFIAATCGYCSIPCS